MADTIQGNKGETEKKLQQKSSNAVLVSLEDGDVRKPSLESFETALTNHMFDVWNVIDFFNSVFLFLFLLFRYLAFNNVPIIEDDFSVTVSQILQISWYNGVSAVFGMNKVVVVVVVVVVAQNFVCS